MVDSAKLSREVKEILTEIRQLLQSLSGGTLRKIPLDIKEGPNFGREVASMVVTLSIFNEVLLRRLLGGKAAVVGGRPPWLAETLDWVNLPKRQPRASFAERKMRELLESLNQCIGYLDDEAFMRIPSQSVEIPEFLTLSIMVQSHLAWYLDVAWFPRMFSFKPPSWVRDLGKQNRVQHE